MVIITCMLYVCYMYVICMLHVCYMYVICMLYVCYVYVICMLYVCYVFIHTLYIYSGYSGIIGIYRMVVIYYI